MEFFANFADYTPTDYILSIYLPNVFSSEGSVGEWVTRVNLYLFSLQPAVVLYPPRDHFGISFYSHVTSGHRVQTKCHSRYNAHVPSLINEPGASECRLVAINQLVEKASMIVVLLVSL